MIEDKIQIITCETVARDISTAIKLENLSDVEIREFPVRCSGKKFNLDELSSYSSDDPQVISRIVIGGSCVSRVRQPHSQKAATLEFEKDVDNLSLYLYPEVVDKYISMGCYMVVPGWLAKWKEIVFDLWKFDKTTARKFFAESCAMIMFIDTGTDTSANSNLKEFSDFVSIPYGAHDVGLSYCRKVISDLVQKKRYESVMKRYSARVEEERKIMADQILAIDMVRRISLSQNLSESIDSILDICRMFFAAAAVEYYPHNPGDETETGKNVNNRSVLANGVVEYDNGFIIPLRCGSDLIGHIHVDNIVFPKYKKSYINLASFLSGLIPSVLYNTYLTEKLRDSENKLKALWSVASMTDADVKTLYDSILIETVKLTKSQYGFFGTMNEDEKIFKIHSWSREAMVDCEMNDKPIEYQIEKAGLWGEAVRKKSEVLINDCSMLNLEGRKGFPQGHVQIKNLMAVPVMSGGRVSAVAAVGNKASNYTKEDLAQLKAFLYSVNSIVQKRLAEEDREKIQKQLLQSQKMESIGHLAGGVAHDFNNMLSIILGAAQYAASELGEEHAAFEEQKVIVETVKRAKDLTSKLLTFSRIDPLMLQLAPVSSVIEDVLGLVKRVYPKTVEIRYEKPNENIIAEYDKNQIHQALLNLCNNAVDAMSGAGTITARLSLEKMDEEMSKTHSWLSPGQYCVISISDTGEGIDEKNLERIFDPFFTTKETGKGTGLGLSVIHGIVKSHGGHVSVESESGKGSSFMVWLPVSEKASHSIEQGNDISISFSGNETVLIVDDEELIARTTQKMLEKNGYKTYTAFDSKKAIQIFKAHKDQIDIVILDYIMPDMDGSRLFDALKEIDPNVKALVASGYSKDGSIDAIMRSGAKGYIQKPYEYENLFATIRKVLNT